MTDKEKKEYNEFLEQKKTQRIESGFVVEDVDLNPALFDFQKYCVKRALEADYHTLKKKEYVAKFILSIS